MATLVLMGAGAAFGGAIGGTILGVSAGAVGAAIGGMAGSVIDQQLMATHHHVEQERPRLTTVNITSSTEGAPIPRLAGRARMAGQIIWATRLEEQIRKKSQTQSGGGKGGGGGGSVTTTTTEYRYFANFAVGLCEGPVTRIGRIWADGKEIDQSEVMVRHYLGTEDQAPDSLIEAKEGAGNAPAYRGLAYVVFERLRVDRFGRRIPQIHVEVWRAVGDLEQEVRGVALIPGATEFGYDPERVQRRGSGGDWEADNRHTLEADTNWQASLDLLQQVAPNTETVLLVVTWFGDDLRCGECQIKPKVERHARVTHKPGSGGPLVVPALGNVFPHIEDGVFSVGWQVAGLARPQAEMVSLIEDVPAYGGTPNDASVAAAIADLKARGLKVIFCPFIMMDVEAGNDLADPYSDNAAESGQPPYPWRGRITVSPAPGFAETPVKTAAAAEQIDTFVTREWGYRNFILHYADLCAEAGGVDGFLIGSEMVGLTTVRSGASTYPFVAALKSLAGEARTKLGAGTKISYAADWSEFHSHRPADGTGDVLFHLDPLWADENIDFIGIDNYLPLADWRDGTEHEDYAPTGPTSIYDPDYLAANIEGGEYYDWFYASPAERAAQMRTPITDTAHGEHWVFRNKDIRNWWLNSHHDRPGGTRATSPTAWVPQSKPIVFTEFGCPAVDKGANQPNVFFDPKSSESFLPHFSSGARDDAMQRAYLEAMIGYWSEPDNNPQSGLYSGAMVDMASSCVWAWDTRMVPSFPQDHRSWADGANWEVGHWISGRLGLAPARETIRDIFERAGFADYDIAPNGSVVDAVIGDRVLSPRAMIEALAPVHQLLAFESGGTVRVRGRLAAGTALTIGVEDLIEPDTGSRVSDGGGRVRKVRAQETDLPAEIHLSYGEPTADDQPAAAKAIRQVTTSRRVVETSAPVVMPADKAQSAAEAMLFDAWHGRERLEFGLPPSFLALEPGDVIRFTPDPGYGPATAGDDYRIDAVTEGHGRLLSLGRMDAGQLVPAPTPRRSRAAAPRREPGPPGFFFFDGPLLQDHLDPHRIPVGALADPWTGGVAFYRSPGDEGFTPDTVVAAPASGGRLAFDFWSGPSWRWDRGNELWVDMAHGELTSAGELAVLGGANALAILNAEGEWEVVQFAEAELTAPGRYRLTKLMRGQLGSEHAMRNPVAAGAMVVVLDEALTPSGLTADEMGLPLIWRIGPAERDVADGSYVQTTFTAEGRALRPLSPVHIRGVRPDGTEDIRLSWTRRTRIGGDSWSQAEVPLGEEAEAYDVEIMDGDSVVRSFLDLAQPRLTYNAAQQVADFGAPVAWPASLTLRVYQRSATFGRGMPATSTLWFPLPVETT